MLARRPLWPWLTLLFLITAAMGLVLFASEQGIGVSPDSTSYLTAARSVLAGKGLLVLADNGRLAPMTHFPPLYPLALAALGLAGWEPALGARVLNALLLGGNLLLVAVAIARLTCKWSWAAPAGALVLLVSVDALYVHSMAWSEPLFILVALAGLLALDAYLRTERLGTLLLAAGVLGLAVLTRYAGIVLLACAALVLWRWSPNQRQRWRRLLILGGVAGLPLLLWLGRGLALAGTATDRQLLFHLPTRDHVDAALLTLGIWLAPVLVFPVWLLPWRLAPAIEIALALLPATCWLAFAVLIYRSRRPMALPRIPIGQSPLAKLLISFVLLYSSFLFVSVSLIDANTYPDGRILFPVRVALIILAMACGQWLVDRLVGRGGWWRVVALSTLIAFSSSQVLYTVNWVHSARIAGLGYSRLSWRNSELIQAIEDLAPDTRIYSNAPDAVYILTGRCARLVPKETDPYSLEPNRSYWSELVTLRTDLENGAVIVWFDAVTYRPFLPTSEELTDLLDLRPVAWWPDGAMLARKSVTEPSVP